MHVSIQEVVLIIAAAAVSGVLARRSHCPWLLGIPVQVAVISFCTPADPVSTLMIAVPCCLLYALAVVKSSRQPEAAS